MQEKERDDYQLAKSNAIWVFALWFEEQVASGHGKTEVEVGEIGPSIKKEQYGTM